MAFTLTINGVSRDVTVESLNINESLHARGTLAGNFISSDGSLVIDLDDELILARDATRMFRGTVARAKLRGADGPAVDSTTWEIIANDSSAPLDYHVTSVTIPSGSTLKAALQLVIPDVPELTLAAGQATGPTLPTEIVFDHTLAREAFGRLISEAINADTYGWFLRVTHFEILEAVAPGASPAPFNLIEGDGTECGDLEVDDRRDDHYATRVIVDGGTVLEYLRTESIVSGGGAVSGVRFPLTYIPFQTYGYVTVNGIAKTLGGSPAEWFLDTATNELVKEDGVPVPVGQVVAIMFDGSLQIVGDTGATSPGPDRIVIETVDGLLTEAEADAAAERILTELGASQKTITYPTRSHGLEVGDSQTVQSAKRLISSPTTYYVSDIITTFDGATAGDGLLYRVSASVTNVVRGTYRTTYRRWGEIGGDGTGVQIVPATSQQGPGAPDTAVQFNDAGLLAGNAAFLFDKTAKTATVEETDGQIILRGKYVTADDAALTVRQKTGSIHGLKLVRTGLSQFVTVRITPTGQLLISHSGATSPADDGIALTDTSNPISLTGQGLTLAPGHVSSSLSALLSGLLQVYAIAPLSRRVTGTTYTIDSDLGGGASPATYFVFDPSGTMTVTLPALSSFAINPGSERYRLLFIRNDSSSFTVTLDGNGSETINGAATYDLAPGASVVLGSRTGTGAGWKVFSDGGSAGAPAAHASSHQAGGSDPIKLDDLAAPDDNTDLNASTAKHGLLPKLSGNSNEFLNGVGAFAVPSGSGSGSGNITDTTAFGSEPSGSPGPDAGDLDLYNNAPMIARYSGSIWQPWGPIFPLTAPVSGDFAWINQGSASIDTANGGIFLLTPAASGDNARIRKKSAPSTPYTLTVGFLPRISNAGFIGAGLCWRQSSDGKLIAALMMNGGDFEVGKWNSATSFNAVYGLTGSPLASRGTMLFLRLTDDGVNRAVSYGFDGQHFKEIHSVGRTDFLTADEIGFMVSANNATATNEAAMTLLHWKET